MPPPRPDSTTPTVRSAGAVALDADGRVLLVRRLKEPGAGLWSIPGGRCEPGEDGARTAERETAEETGLTVSALRLLGHQLLPNGEHGAYDNEDWLVRVHGGDLRAGDDAGDVRWCAPGDLRAEELTDDLLTWLRSYGVID